MESTLSWIIFGAVILAFWHFVLEAAVAPNWRFAKRMRLFELRDEVRRLMIERHDDADIVAACKLLQARANTGVRVLSKLNILEVHRFTKLIDRDPGIRRNIEAQQTMIDTSSSDAVKQIADELDEIVHSAFYFNASGWFVYLVPIAISVMFAQSCTAALSELLRAPDHIIDKAIGRQASLAP